jgi:hypothetical protein
VSTTHNLAARRFGRYDRSTTLQVWANHRNGHMVTNLFERAAVGAPLTYRSDWPRR